MSNKETSNKDITTEERANKFLEAYKQVKEQAFILESINKDFFFEFVDCLLEEREQDKKRIQELEEELKYRADNTAKLIEVTNLYLNSIPKQKVKDLKESTMLDNTIVGGRRNAKTLEYGIKLGKIKAYEELLEGEK